MLLALCTALALFAGCTMDAPRSGGGPAGSPAAGGKLRLAGVGFQNDQFFKLIESGMKAEAEEQGVSLALGSSAGALDKESSLVESYISQKMDAIVIAPLSAKASVPALQRAHDSGIKVITYDSPLEAPFPESSIKSDQTALGSATGKEAVEYVREKLNGKAKIAIISYISLAPEPARKRTEGFRTEIKKLPGVEIVAEQDAWLADKAVGVVESILTAHPDLDLIWAANEGGTVGAVTAVKNSGKAGKVAVFGTDISEQIADFLLSGDNVLQAVTGQKPFDIGSRAVEAAVKAVKGEKIEADVSLPGLLFTRRRPDEVTKYKEYLGSLGQ